MLTIIDLRNKQPCCFKTLCMETIIKELSFDKEMVSNLKNQKVDIDLLYVYLMNGKITMKEYLHLCGIKKQTTKV